jgi:hypothetical protein
MTDGVFEARRVSAAELLFCSKMFLSSTMSLDVLLGEVNWRRHMSPEYEVLEMKSRTTAQLDVSSLERDGSLM